MIEAAIFDMDGLLIDSEPLWRRAERAVFAAVGLELTDEDCRQTTGLRSDEVVSYWYERRPWSGASPADVHRDLVRLIVDIICDRGRPQPGARRTIGAVRDAGLRLALASSSPHAVIEVALATLGLDDAFEVVCSADDEARGKPDPAVYRTTLRRLDLPAADCVALEDSAAGVAAAKAAGLVTIAVPDPAAFDDPRFDIADFKLRSLVDFELSLVGMR